MWELASGLSRLGHRVTMICSSFANSSPRQIKDGVEIIRLRNSWKMPFDIFRQYLKEGSSKFDAVIEEVIGGQRLPFCSVLYVKSPLFAVWYQRNTKIFFEQYSFPVAISLSMLERFLAALYRSFQIIALSEDAKEKLVSLGLRREKIKIVHAAVADHYAKIKMNAVRKDVIVCLGKMRRYKRIDHALFAFSRALSISNRENWRLIVAGKVSEIDKGYIDNLRELSESLGIADKVEFLINIREEKKIEVLKNAKILLQPSPVEGFSIVVAEANRCGTPVVVSDGVPKDVVKKSYNGLVYPFGDLEKLANHIRLLMEDEAVWRTMSANAFEWSKKFTWEKSTLELNTLLEQIPVRSRISGRIQPYPSKASVASESVK